MKRPRTWLIGVALVLGTGAVVAAMVLSGIRSSWAYDPYDATYVGRQSCIECHAEQHDKWVGSDHDLAMDLARPDTVLGDFNDASFTLFDVTTRFTRRGDDYFAHTEGPDGQMAEFQIKYVFGYDPLQQYLVEFPDGRVQCLTIAWDVHRKRWFSLYPDEKIPHDDWLHWTKRGQNWNYMCAECHTTNFRKNYDLASNTYRTTFSEIDVSCEACHGPASRHVTWAKSPLRGLAGEQIGLAKLKGRDHRPQIDMCAKCHSHRRVIHGGHHAGADFYDHYYPALIDHRPLYHDDGQILEEVYEHGSYLQSKMYHTPLDAPRNAAASANVPGSGVRCTDCHDPHTTRVYVQGNALCVRCHQHSAEKYDTPAHHHHPEGTIGTHCVECHMPAKNYMRIDARRDHSLRVPRPDLTVELGVPNACNGCHYEHDAKWAAEQIEQWFGAKERPRHWAHGVAAARAGRFEGRSLLLDAMSRPDTPVMARASAASLVGSYGGDEVTAKLVAAMNDPSPLVRSAALSGLGRALTDEQRIARLNELAKWLDDPVRAVRLEAAKLLLPIARQCRASSHRAAFDRAVNELRTGLAASADDPGAHVDLAMIEAALGDAAAAMAEFETALRLDPRYNTARIELARHHLRTGRLADAESALAEALRIDPNDGEAHYAMALLLAEPALKRPLESVIEHLRRAVALLTHPARAYYNLGLALDQSNRPDEAEQAYRKACELEPHAPDFIYAMTVHYVKRNRWAQAAPFAERLLRLAPGDPNVRALVDQVRVRMLVE